MSLPRTLGFVLVVAVVLIGLGSLGGASARAAAPTAAAAPAGAGALSGPSDTGTGGSIAPSPAVATHAAVVQDILHSAKLRHLPTEAVSLPNLLRAPARLANGVVSPLTTVAPAPMGLGDFGVRNTTGTAVPYTLRSTSWEGSLTLHSVNPFLINNDGPDVFGVQLNTVTTNTTVMDSSTYSFWTQNVMYYIPSQSTVIFLDNIWNFSDANVGANEPASTFYSYNGTPVSPTFYYDFGPTLYVPMPFTVHLFINSSITNLTGPGDGFTTVRFGYQILDGTGALSSTGVFDTVLFNSSRAIGTVPVSPFMVNGSALTPTGFLLYDAELMIGGPGGGTTTSIYGINGTEQLRYLNDSTHTYQNDPTAWNVGTDTGETSEGISETYTTPGTVQLDAGPSMPTPLWNATPGGHIGRAHLTGPIGPTNAFVFFTPGKHFDDSLAAWAPTQTSSSVDFVVPPGTYAVRALMSEYSPTTRTLTVGAGVTHVNFRLHADARLGIYTPLFAWENSQLAAISSSGTGASWSPYQIVNHQRGSLDPVFGEFNDYLYAVFPGVLFSGTTAHVEMNDPASFAVSYPRAYDAYLTSVGLPTDNHLSIELYYTSHVTIWGAQAITGWFFLDDYGPTGYLPLANVVLWGATDTLIGHNSFVSQGSSLLLMQGSGNVVWGNRFVDGPQSAAMLYNGTPVGIWTFESGDLIYNNYVATYITAYEQDTNLYDGSFQVNLESWNLTKIEPAGQVAWVNGYPLSGSIVGGKWQGGNYWSSYVPGSSLPYNDFGFIAEGGDYLPLPIVAYSVVFSGHHVHGTWSVTLNGVTESTRSSTLVFYEVNGSYAYTVTPPTGRSVSPSSGTVVVAGANQHLTLRFS
jgi:Thermopsin